MRAKGAQMVPAEGDTCPDTMARYSRSRIFSAVMVERMPGADQVLRHHREAGGVPVQPVGAAEDEGLFLLFVVPGQGIGQGVCVVVHGGMDGHAGGLVEDDDVLVLIDDIQRQMDGRDFFQRRRPRGCARSVRPPPGPVGAYNKVHHLQGCSRASFLWRKDSGGSSPSAGSTCSTRRPSSLFPIIYEMVLSILLSSFSVLTSCFSLGPVCSSGLLRAAGRRGQNLSIAYKIRIFTNFL